jgi:hypothetical protein
MRSDAVHDRPLGINPAARQERLDTETGKLRIPKAHTFLQCAYKVVILATVINNPEFSDGAANRRATDWAHSRTGVEFPRIGLLASPDSRVLAPQLTVLVSIVNVSCQA